MRNDYMHRPRGPAASGRDGLAQYFFQASTFRTRVSCARLVPLRTVSQECPLNAASLLQACPLRKKRGARSEPRPGDRRERQSPDRGAEIAVINKRHEHEHARSRVRPLGSGSPRAHRSSSPAGRERRRPSSWPTWPSSTPGLPVRRRWLRFALHLLHGGASAVRGRRLQPHLTRLGPAGGFPVILDLLASGALSLTSVRMLRPHLTPENHEAVLAGPAAEAGARSKPWSRSWRRARMCPSSVRKLPTATPRAHIDAADHPACRRPASTATGARRPRRRHRSPLHRRHRRRAVRSSRRRRPSAIASSSRSARRATTSCGAFRPFSAARSRTAIPARSSTARSPCSSRRSRRRSSGRRRSRGRARLSVPGRIGSLRMRRHRFARHPRATSSARPGSATATSAPSSARTDGDAPSARSWSSITSGPTRWGVRRPSRTSRSAVGATTNTRRSWSSVRMGLLWSGRVRRRGTRGERNVHRRLPRE